MDDSIDQLTSQYYSELVSPSSVDKVIIKPVQFIYHVILLIVLSNF
jgi:hypothetical protein